MNDMSDVILKKWLDVLEKNLITENRNQCALVCEQMYNDVESNVKLKLLNRIQYLPIAVVDDVNEPKTISSEIDIINNEIPQSTTNRINQEVVRMCESFILNNYNQKSILIKSLIDEISILKIDGKVKITVKLSIDFLK